tara:strand:- start:125 stop:418 length:294 start_codon:yes stop_codon:yes gene_type:complete
MTIENLTIRQLIDMMVSKPSNHVNNLLYSGDQVNPNTQLQFYFLKGYNLEAMEIESVIFTNDSPGLHAEPRIEITVKGVGTDEGGNDPDDDVGVSVL